MNASITQEKISQMAVKLGIPDHPFTQRRIVRAFDIMAADKVTEITRDDDGVTRLAEGDACVLHYRVGSQYDANKSYVVNLNHGDPSCDCPDGNKTLYCKHHIASLLYAKQEQRMSKLTIYDESKGSRYGRWRIMDYGKRKGYIVDRDSEGTLSCPCCSRSTQCKHKKAVRTYIGGNGSKITSECGTETAKALQEKLNGSNGTGGNSHPSTYQLDTNDPFQECEMLDIDQIEGKRNGDLVHVLSNGEYVISYRGIMKLAEQHKITFEAARHDETRTVIAHGRCGSNSRASGKPINGSEMTALELAKRNAARQLLPYPEVKALEYKAKQTAFDWQKAKAACLELVPNFKLDIIIDDLVRDGTLRQAHPSDYKRSEWILIFDTVKKDAAEITNDGGDDIPSSDDEQITAVCCICGRTLTNKLSISRCVGPECFKKVGAQGAQFLRDDAAVPSARREVSDELIKASKLYQDEALRKRIIKACLTLDAPLPVKVLNWLGNEYFGYRNRAILYYIDADGQLNRIDTHRRKLRHAIITRDTAETELDAHALAQMVVDVAEDETHSSATREELPGKMDEFIARCKQAEADVVDNTTDDNSVDESATAPMVEVSQMDGDDKRKLQMDKNLMTWLVEADGTKTEISCREICEQFSRPRAANFVLQLRSGIDSGGDISTVELD